MKLDRPVTSRVGDQGVRLCSVLEELTGQSDGVQAFHGLPWLTPILGSGCLSLRDRPGIDIRGLEDTVRTVLDPVGLTVPEDLELGFLARAFAQAMVGTWAHHAVDTGGAKPSPRAAQFVTLCALLTRLYHGASLVTPTPNTRRWRNERVRWSNRTRFERRLEAEKELILQLIENLEPDLRVRKEQGEHLSLQQETLFQVLDGLGHTPPVVGLDPLRQLTELTWHALTRDTAIYPGWSDLFIDLLLLDSDRPTDSLRHRPQVRDIHKVGDWIARLLADPTNHSWASRVDDQCDGDSRDAGELTERNRFYDSIARLLRQQASLRSLFHPPEDIDRGIDDAIDAEPPDQIRQRQDLGRNARFGVDSDTAIRAKRAGTSRRVPLVDIPPPVAFVTSFDLELEMALWATGEPFFVVLPALVRIGDSSDAGLVWLAAKLDPREQGVADAGDLAALRSGAHRWQLSSDQFGDPERIDHPTVVRLTGCPLLTLPDFDDPHPSSVASLEVLEASLSGSSRGRVSLVHAVMVDEYSSLLHSESEVYFSSADERQGLPWVFTNGTRSNPRAWLALGVQFDDPAVRSRVLMQLSIGSLRERFERQFRGEVENDAAEIDEQWGSSAICGWALNRRLDPDEASALAWLGFSLAVDRTVAAYTDDISHCADHLEHASSCAAEVARLHAAGQATTKVEWKRPLNQKCELEPCR